MPRCATLAGVAGIEDTLLRLKRKSEFATIKVEFERGRNGMHQCISAPQGFAAVAQRHGKITRVLIGVTTNYWCIPPIMPTTTSAIRNGLGCKRLDSNASKPLCRLAANRRSAAVDVRRIWTAVRDGSVELATARLAVGPSRAGVSASIDVSCRGLERRSLTASLDAISIGNTHRREVRLAGSDTDDPHAP
jgi:hypothetical protein